ASVVLAKRESILVYPTGLIATVITMYLFFKDRLLGDMMINLYYSLMSIYGWWNWSRQKEGATVVNISRTDKTEKGIGFLLFLAASGLNYLIYKVFDVPIGPSNYVDILTSGIFFTAMWFMATKKLENWTLWILADLITVPLYAYRGWGMLSLQYFIFTILAIQGYREWKKRLNKSLQTS
ncbi:MAG: nicotinamide riboside transporter PnuC, partial [Robiginitalea sp.]|uniref:nicotinamide riboside transporter PnuC n=2 Tax=Robiginitalea sp. TaxID=1902411 RepID=UPI003C76246D